MSLGGMSLGHASADSNTGNGVGGLCQQNLAYVDYAVYEALLYSDAPVSQPPALTVGACASLLTTFFNGTYATSAPYPSICSDIGASLGITDPAFQGQCVASISSSGFKYELNYLLAGFVVFGP